MLDKAYANISKARNPNIYIGSTDNKGDTLVIAGSQPPWTTQGVTDWGLNDPLIPIIGTQHTQRYVDATRYLRKHPEVQYVVGHSLGAAVGNDVQVAFPDKAYYLFNTPEISFGESDRPNVHRYADELDPVAMGSWSSKGKSVNPFARGVRYSVPHSYQ